MRTDSRREILNNIAAIRSKRVAAIDIPTTGDDAIYKPILPDSLTCFVSELEAVSGQCIVCNDETELYFKLAEFVHSRGFPYLFCRDSQIEKQLIQHTIACSNNPADFEQMQAGITPCELLIARTGSVLMSSEGASGRQMTVFPPVHIIVAKTSQLVNYLTDAYVWLQKKYGSELPSMLTTITGPSRTADIEKTLVLGAHGPKELVVFLSKIGVMDKK